MTADLDFWAQPLDNSADELVFRGDVEVPSSDHATRRQIVARVNDVIRLGGRVYCNDGVSLSVNDGWFVAEVPSREKDVMGRVAPLVCIGPIEAIADVASRQPSHLAQFAARIGRTVEDRHLENLARAIEELKKKVRLRTSMLAGAALALVSLIVIWLLTWQTPQERLPQKQMQSEPTQTEPSDGGG